MNGWMNEWINGYFKPVFCCCDGIRGVTEDDTDVLVWYKSAEGKSDNETEGIKILKLKTFF